MNWYLQFLNIGNFSEFLEKQGMAGYVLSINVAFTL